MSTITSDTCLIPEVTLGSFEVLIKLCVMEITLRPITYALDWSFSVSERRSSIRRDFKSLLRYDYIEDERLVDLLSADPEKFILTPLTGFSRLVVKHTKFPEEWKKFMSPEDCKWELSKEDGFITVKDVAEGVYRMKMNYYEHWHELLSEIQFHSSEDGKTLNVAVDIGYGS